MRTYRLWITSLLACIVWTGVYAHVPDPAHRAGKPNKVKYRDVCAASEWQIDQEINNVRARLLGGGDCWWNFEDGRYIVPKVDVSSGQTEVSSIFAGSVWLGGVDPGGNLKLACQDYRPNGDNDFWPGPLWDSTGSTDEVMCKQWDRYFRVTGDEIRQHLTNLANGNRDPSSIPRGVRGWPAKGNKEFVKVWGFTLPDNPQGLAGFYDAGGDNADGIYNPLDGDYPSIEIKGCETDRYPDEMIFWIYNDQGGGADHARTKGNAIQMEVQVQAFGYVTNDELNDMTFQRYKLINRAIEEIDSTFFAMWVDPDLGCYVDDYIGCDTTKNLMYVYNQDATDGSNGCACDQGVPSYCNDVPILGVDYFRGPLDEFGDEIGMSSFVYYNNPGVGNPEPATTDPDLPEEFYNYLTGRWRNRAEFQYGGSGYNSGGAPIRYALTDAPNNPFGWSMCTANLPYGDRRTLQATGPFRLLPGATNELIIGVPWVPDIEYPCPDLENLFRADKLAQGLFDNCFEILDGPDAPTVDWIELNQEVIAVLTNDLQSSTNNKYEAYSQQDFLAPDTLIKHVPPAAPPTPEEIESTYYKFEGYKIYQLANPNVSNAEFETNPEKSRLVYQVDLRNGISSIYNWLETRNPNTGDIIYYPEQRVQGENKGIRHTFSVKDDKFATGNDKRLINHKKYYFAVIAYSYNNWGTFDPLARPAPGQQRPYLPGRKAADGGQIKIITVIPRPIIDQSLHASYGDGVVVSRLEGAGNNGNFLDLDSATRVALWNGITDTVLTYKPGRGPITVTIYNPFEVKNGDYEISLVDGNLTDKKLDANAKWELRKLPDGQVIASERTLAEVNEQIVEQYGFSVSINQPAEPGSLGDDKNGGIGAETEYADRSLEWLFGYPDQEEGVFNFVKTEKVNDLDKDLDPEQSLSTLGDGWFAPYPLCDWRISTEDIFVTPAWTQQSGLNGSAMGNPDARRDKLARLPNVDIVLTPDKSKWSRCVIVESAPYYYLGTEYPHPASLIPESPPPPAKTRLNFDVRYAPSVGKEDNDNDGRPDPDGAVNPSGSGIPASQVGKPVYGMGWFPGYAIDVETGRRLNVFFGENSCYSPDRVSNGAFHNDLGGWLATSGWKWSSGVASHVPGKVDSLEQAIIGLAPNTDYQLKLKVAGMSSGSLTVRLGLGVGQQVISITSNGTYTQTLKSGSSGTTIVIKATQDFNGTIDDVELIDLTRSTFTGRDMLWNPTEQVFLFQQFGGIFDLILGGQHWIYVTNTPYDECESLRRGLTPEFNATNPAVAKITRIRNIAWAGMLQLGQGYQLKPLRDGLIPTETTVKLRVNNAYQTWYQDNNGGQLTGHPKYQFSIRDREPTDIAGIEIENALDSIKAVPNPYYGYSQYETSQFTNTVKITNLPGKCTVTIYSLDGKFIRQYQRNEEYGPYEQITPAIEWDMKNNKGIPVASGIYLIHVSAQGLGERTIKWFGIGRQFDPSGL